MAAKSVRLTQNIRYELVCAVVKDLYEAEIANVDRLEAEAYCAVFEEAVRGVALTSYRMSSVSIVLMRVDGTRRNSMYFHPTQTGGPYEIPVDIRREIRDDALAAKMEAAHAETNALRTKKNTLNAKMWDLLNSCTTTAQLLAVWPDGQKYLAAILPAETDKTVMLERDRRLKAAALAQIFNDAGVDALTPCEVLDGETTAV